MRALVISDTHFGAWTGEDLLRHDHELGLLAGHLDDVDELVFLGDLFDFLFATVRDAVAASDGLFSLLREKLQGYLRQAWPGTAVLIDSDEPAPQLLEIRKHLSPLERARAPA